MVLIEYLNAHCVGSGGRGDVLFGITISSRSANVIAALRAACEMGISTVGAALVNRRANSVITPSSCLTPRLHEFRSATLR